MNPKLIITSIAGIGALGGGATGCYYYCRQKTSEKQTETLDTPTSPQTQNLENKSTSVPEARQEVALSQEQSSQNQVTGAGAQTPLGSG